MVINCPKCKTIIAKGFDELALMVVDFSFSVRCHKCQSDLELMVRSVMKREVTLARRSIDRPPPITRPDDETRVFVSE